MKLIDADELLRTFTVNSDGQRITEKDCDNFDLTISLKEIKRIIKEQPAAYDVNKVIIKLVTLDTQYLLMSHNTEDEKCIYAYDQVRSALDDAIEIIKRGGIN